MKLVTLILLLIGPALYAHPLDDKAQMTSEVVIVSDQRLEYVLHFRYVDSAASYAEVSGGLDGNNDGIVTAAELKRRFNVLVDELTFALTISVDGKPVALEPDFDRFLFQDMTRVGDLDLHDGVNVENIRIHYRFVFWWEAPKPLDAGDHRVEYVFNGLQTVVHTPAEQMVAFDARKSPRERMTAVSHSSVGLPRLAFTWSLASQQPQAEVTQPEAAKQLPETMPTPEFGTCIAIGWELWAVLAAAALLTLCGLATIGKSLRNGRKHLVRGVVVTLVGAIALVWMLNVVRVLQF
jgi:hypothetical protein